MAQIGFAVTGFTSTIDRNELDYRCFFSPASDSPGTPWNDPLTPSYASGVSFEDAFKFFWNIRTITLSWNFSSNSGSTSGSGTASPVNPGSEFGGTERSLLCSLRTNNFTSGGFNLTWRLNGYDTLAKPGTFGFFFFTTMGQLSFDPGFGWPDSGISFTFLGNTAILYGDPGNAPYSGSIDITANDYWPYSGSETTVRNSVNNEELITPAPNTLF